MPDILTCRDAAVRKLRLMEEGPFPGGFEFTILQEEGADGKSNQQEEAQNIHLSRGRTNSNVTTNKRDRSAIRNEFVQCSINFFD